MNYRDAKANYCREQEGQGIFIGSLKVGVCVGYLFAVGYLLSWLIVNTN
jgi:hypothetical protein